ncbi:bacterial sensory transduction regulator family protein [Burkholderia pseudomallei MSHR7527]|uniref:YbjN domain-containing protein n=1 Tax=Burkholderia pseudomallei TaxID=28450 RepID=UPI000531EBE7|nr:YbjN domain-containing protein [Burkholderia pseudomallei]KGS70703.1 bacterial sensory transduction regulator family protein [Burkholderia pseudomallei MSHR7527]
MTRVFDVHEITIETLDAHLRDSGVVPYNVQPDHIRLRTEQGIAFTISIIPERKFIRFSTYLPLNRHASTDQKHELARRLNEDVFLPVFTIDGDGDLIVAYSLPYTGGLIAGTYVSIVNRFASLLEFVVETYNGGALIDFGAPTTIAAVADPESGPTSGELLH